MTLVGGQNQMCSILNGFDDILRMTQQVIVFITPRAIHSRHEACSVDDEVRWKPLAVGCRKHHFRRSARHVLRRTAQEI